MTLYLFSRGLTEIQGVSNGKGYDKKYTLVWVVHALIKAYSQRNEPIG